MPRPEPRGGHEAAGIYRGSRRRGGAWPLPRARSKPSACGASACSWAASRAIRKYRPASRHLCKALAQLGWIDGRNVRIDYRWGEGNADDIRKHAAELVALAPDVILTPGGLPVERLLQATRTVPIVFAIAPDPVGSGMSRVCRSRAAMSPALCSSNTI